VDRDTVVVRRLPEAAQPAHAERPESEATGASRGTRALRRASRLALNAAFVAMMAAVAIMLLPAALGYHRYVILTGSMTGTYDRGSIVFDRPVPIAQLKVGDPITYSPPPGFTSQARVTHRIWWIGRGQGGARAFRTKGDANKAPDAWKFTLTRPTQDRVAFHIPYVGYVFTLLSIRNFRMVLIGVPAVLIGLFMIFGLWRDAGQEVRSKRLAEQGWQTMPDTGPGMPLPPLGAPAASRPPVTVDLSFLRPRPASAAPLPSRPSLPHRFRPGRPVHIGRIASRRPGITNGQAHGDRGPGMSARPRVHI
jgi:signal peptidase I